MSPPSSRLKSRPSKKSVRRQQPSALLAPLFMLVSCLALSTLKMEETFPPKRQFASNGLHNVISQEIELLKLRSFVGMVNKFRSKHIVHCLNLPFLTSFVALLALLFALTD
jgi:hypothetical protein